VIWCDSAEKSDTSPSIHHTSHETPRLPPAGASPHIRTNARGTPLHCAATCARSESVDLLLRRSPNIAVNLSDSMVLEIPGEPDSLSGGSSEEFTRPLIERVKYGALLKARVRERLKGKQELCRDEPHAFVYG